MRKSQIVLSFMKMCTTHRYNISSLNKLWLQALKPKPLPKFLVLIEPFSLEVWLTFMTTIIISSLVILLIGVMHPHEEESPNSLVGYYIVAVLNQTHPGILRLKSTSLRWANQHLTQLPKICAVKTKGSFESLLSVISRGQ